MSPASLAQDILSDHLEPVTSLFSKWLNGNDRKMKSPIQVKVCLWFGKQHGILQNKVVFYKLQNQISCMLFTGGYLNRRVDLPPLCREDGTYRYWV
jgi:hypothetical protein